MAETRRKLVKKASKMKDPIVSLECLPEGELTTSDGERLSWSTSWATNLPPETTAWAFDLFEKNMRLLYERSHWGWDPESKKAELGATTARFIVISNDKGDLIAYSHYRLDMDLSASVLYCYEIQVEKEYQRKGVGALIMHVLETLASKLAFDKIMATVFKFNVQSLKFFAKLGYEEDESNLPTGDEEGLDYTILSKAAE